MRKQPYENYVYGSLPTGQLPAAIMIIEQKEYLNTLYSMLMREPFAKHLHLYTKPYQKNQGLSQLFITAKVDQLHPIHKLMQQHQLQYVRVLSNHEDAMLKEMAKTYDIKAGNDVVKQIEAYFYHP